MPVASLSATGDAWKTIGHVPPAPALQAVLAWLEVEADSGMAHSDRISLELPELAPYAGIASGVLGIVLPKPVANALVWFRPEIIETVRWGGDPYKAGASDDGRLRPRASFAEWKETVRATALPWSATELEAAVDLRRYATEVDLARQVRREQQAVRLRDEVVAVVSHDLRNPINVIQLAAAQLRRLHPTAAEPSARERELLGRVERATSRMSSLVHDLLDPGTH